MVSQLRVGVPATLMIVVLGLPTGLLWTLVAPRTTYLIAGGKAFLGDPETQTLIAADGWFAVLTAAAGLVCGVIAYLIAGRLGELALLVSLAVGGTAAGVVAWWTGHRAGLSAFQHVLRTGRDGVTAQAALNLHASGVVIAWPLVALVAYGLLETLDLAGRESRGRLAAGYPGHGRAGQSHQVGGGELDLQAAPPGRDVDGREG